MNVDDFHLKVYDSCIKHTKDQKEVLTIKVHSLSISSNGLRSTQITKSTDGQPVIEYSPEEWIFFQALRRQEDVIAMTGMKVGDFTINKHSDKSSECSFRHTTAKVKFKAGFKNPILDQDENIIEPYTLKIFNYQQDPMNRNKIKVKSSDMLDISASYALILRLSQSLVHFRWLQSKKENYVPAVKIPQMQRVLQDWLHR